MSDALGRLVPEPIRRNYAVKFSLALLIVIAVIGGVGAFIYLETGSQLAEDTSRDLQTSVAIQQQFIDQTLQQTQAEVAGLSTSSSAQNTETLSETQALMQNAASPAYVDSMYYVNTETGEVFAQTGSGTGIADGSLTDAFQQRLSTMESVPPGQTATSAPFETTSTNAGDEMRDRQDKDVMLVRSRVPNEEQRSFVAVLDMQRLSVTALPQVSYGEVVVLDQDGKVMLSGNRSKLLTQDVVDPSRLSDDELDTVATDDGTVVVGSQSLTSEDWVVTRRVPESEAFAIQNSIRTQLLLMVGLALGSIAVIGLTIGRNTATSVSRLSERAKAIEDGNLETEIQSERADEIGALYGTIDSMRRSLKEQLDAVQTARDDAEDARAEAERLNSHLEQKADQYRDVMQAAGAGDLTVRMDADSESEAMTAIAEEFNSMITELETTTDRVKAFAGDVATASEQVTASSEEVRSASEQVTESIQEISDGAERQNRSLQSANSEMDQLSTTTEEIAASSNEVADLAERTAETGREGRDAAQEAIEGMAAIEDESEEAVDAIQSLEDEVAQIDELIDFITEVAKETNMLALNANIEASRGGDGGEGDGFAVVAQQVKELAQDTKETAENIEQRLERIKERTDATSEEVQRTSDRIAEQAGSVKAAAAALDDVAEYATETNEGVQEISAATEQQAASTEEVVAMVDDAATISEETTTEAENVAAAAEEQTTSLTEVSNSASELADQAGHLSEALDRFDTDVERDDGWEVAPNVLEDSDADYVASPDPAPGGENDEDDNPFEFQG
ncbi:methyl-accepting chemotaxis protein [Haloarchaeobius sp. HRN-SO-5]|uniref:methyl-accepting chemotaxis protein n=1 Tax=Haloarchaeobius sp. HRN-SO-5 TaxID=3446118 RepID=UPI003EB98C0A